MTGLKHICFQSLAGWPKSCWWVLLVVETNGLVKAGLVWSCLIHGTRSQKAPPTEILFSQVVCRVQSIDWYSDASTSFKWYKCHPPSRTATYFTYFFRLNSPKSQWVELDRLKDTQFECYLQILPIQTNQIRVLHIVSPFVKNHSSLKFQCPQHKKTEAAWCM